jgi:two-component system, response regulator
MGNKFVLLVEDNDDEVELTLRSFKKHKLANEVVVMKDGAEALEYIFGTGKHAGRDLSVMPQVILLDLKLPKVDGLELLKRLRSDERTKLIPVTILTSSREEQDVVNSYKFGANSYIRKPLDFERFSETIRQLGLYWLVLNEPVPKEAFIRQY